MVGSSEVRLKSSGWLFQLLEQHPASKIQSTYLKLLFQRTSPNLHYWSNPRKEGRLNKQWVSTSNQMVVNSNCENCNTKMQGQHTTPYYYQILMSLFKGFDTCIIIITITIISVTYSKRNGTASINNSTVDMYIIHYKIFHTDIGKSTYYAQCVQTKATFMLEPEFVSLTRLHPQWYHKQQFLYVLVCIQSTGLEQQKFAPRK